MSESIRFDDATRPVAPVMAVLAFRPEAQVSGHLPHEISGCQVDVGSSTKLAQKPDGDVALDLRVHQVVDVRFVDEDEGNFIVAVLENGRRSRIREVALEGSEGRLVQERHLLRSAHVAVELNKGEAANVRFLVFFVDEEDFCRGNGAEQERREAKIGCVVDGELRLGVSDGLSFAVRTDVTFRARFTLLPRVETALRRLEALTSAGVLVTRAVVGADTRLLAVVTKEAFNAFFARRSSPVATGVIFALTRAGERVALGIDEALVLLAIKWVAEACAINAEPVRVALACAQLRVAPLAHTPATTDCVVLRVSRAWNVTRSAAPELFTFALFPSCVAVNANTLAVSTLGSISAALTEIRVVALTNALEADFCGSVGAAVCVITVAVPEIAGAGDVACLSGPPSITSARAIGSEGVVAVAVAGAHQITPHWTRAVAGKASEPVSALAVRISSHCIKLAHSAIETSTSEISHLGAFPTAVCAGVACVAEALTGATSAFEAATVAAAGEGRIGV